MTDKALIQRIRRGAKRIGFKLTTKQLDDGRWFVIARPGEREPLMATTDGDEVDQMLQALVGITIVRECDEERSSTTGGQQ